MGRTDPFQPEHRSMDLPSVESSSPSPSEQEEESPKNKSTSFSISAILSEDVGRKRTHTTNAAGGIGKQLRKEGNGGGGSPTSTISLSQAASMMMTSPVGGGTMMRPALQATSYPPTFLHRTPTQPSHHTPSQPSHYTPSRHTPRYTPSQPSRHTPSRNNSLSMSPFNASLLQVLGQQSSPASQDSVFEDSLGMLSTVALYHSELSTTSGASTPVQDRLAAMRITSTSDISEGSRESTDASESSGTSMSKKSTTPYILKRDKRRRRKSSGSFRSHHSELKNSCEESATLNVGFLSPSSVEKSPSKLKHLTFSPSIFLSRPDGTSTSTVSASECSSSSGSVLMSSPTSEPECAGGSSFVTSTPIKSDKENVLSVSPSGWSPNLLHSGSRRRKHVLREPTELSSGSDSELPPKRPRTVPRKSRARTKLSPLLENACSPIAKANPPQPSPLITASVPACTSMYVPSSSLPLISVQDHDHTTRAQTFYMPHVQPLISQPAYPHLFATSASPGQLMMAQQHMYMPLPTTQLLTQHYYNNIMTSTQWNASPLPAQWGKTGPIQSVPPWFIFSNNKSEGKRSRLTEAINHSISETPLQNPKLPPGWTKLACGQTDDQKTLTEKARSFLQCRPRQLTFDDPVN